jgi:hypothetical protein
MSVFRVLVCLWFKDFVDIFYLSGDLGMLLRFMWCRDETV